MAVKKDFKYSVQGSSSEEFASMTLRIPEKNSRYLLHRAIVNQQKGRLQGTSNTKTRSEVRGGGKKPWKQKGTGQARSGSKNSPLWNGGGVAFGPKPRSYRKKINSKEWRLALQTTLFNSSNKITVIGNFMEGIDKPNTQKVLEQLKQVSNLEDRTLLILKEPNINAILSLRNVNKLDILYSNTLNVKDLLIAKNIIIAEDALENIQKTYHD